MAYFGVSKNNGSKGKSKSLFDIDLGSIAPKSVTSGVIDYFSPRDERRAANAAAEQQRLATDKASQLTEERFNEAQQFQQPYLDAGQSTFLDLLKALQEGRFNAPEPPPVQDFGAMARKYTEIDPGADYRQKQALKAIENSAAARGGRLGSGAINAINRNIQDLASQEYGQAYGRGAQSAQMNISQSQNRYDQIRDNLNQYFQKLQGFANLGPQTAGNLANQRIGLAGQQAGFAQDIGNINAANISAKQDAKNAAMSNIANLAGTAVGAYFGGPAGAAIDSKATGMTGPAPAMSTGPAAQQLYGNPSGGNYYTQYGNFNAGVPAQPNQGITDYTQMGNDLANMWRVGYPGAQ